ncbi:ORF6C domain-containing protein [Clostridium sporogenes]|uniref:ORF6C domain-containing protein n=1 Tax=Clostridium sporogenes TaxID=1509 RepID=A0AAE4FN70_CLOSG|nr:ORF6C domain-containing protein [Clostridium sporogenes]MDS1005325.1 ORF6C domain-containing protein [Clostridium sporogenes]
MNCKIVDTSKIVEEMSNLIKINNKNLQIKELEDQRVVTFKDIDILHERVQGTAGRNFSENKKHFIEGVDYFHLSYEELRSTNFVERPNPKGLILITESGYLMLVKSLTDDLAWKVQRELVNKYFKIKEDPYKSLSKELKAVLILDEKTQEIEEKVNDLESNMPLFNIECKELQALVRKVGTKVLGGYRTPAYKDNSLRGKVYADIQGQLKRQFGVNRYEAIKRMQLETAKEILGNYAVPIYLENQIINANNQVSF